MPLEANHWWDGYILKSLNFMMRGLLKLSWRFEHPRVLPFRQVLGAYDQYLSDRGLIYERLQTDIVLDKGNRWSASYRILLTVTNISNEPKAHELRAYTVDRPQDIKLLVDGESVIHQIEDRDGGLNYVIKPANGPLAPILPGATRIVAISYKVPSKEPSLYDCYLTRYPCHNFSFSISFPEGHEVETDVYSIFLRLNNHRIDPMYEGFHVEPITSRSDGRIVRKWIAGQSLLPRQGFQHQIKLP